MFVVWIFLTGMHVTMVSVSNASTEPSPATQDGCVNLLDDARRALGNISATSEYSVVTLTLNQAIIMTAIFGLFCITLAHAFNWIRVHVYEDQVIQNLLFF